MAIIYCKNKFPTNAFSESLILPRRLQLNHDEDLNEFLKVYSPEKLSHEQIRTSINTILKYIKDKKWLEVSGNGLIKIYYQLGRNKSSWGFNVNKILRIGLCLNKIKDKPRFKSLINNLNNTPQVVDTIAEIDIIEKLIDRVTFDLGHKGEGADVHIKIDSQWFHLQVKHFDVFRKEYFDITDLMLLDNASKLKHLNGAQDVIMQSTMEKINEARENLTKTDDDENNIIYIRTHNTIPEPCIRNIERIMIADNYSHICAIIISNSYEINEEFIIIFRESRISFISKFLEIFQSKPIYVP